MGPVLLPTVAFFLTVWASPTLYGVCLTLSRSSLLLFLTNRAPAGYFCSSDYFCMLDVHCKILFGSMLLGLRREFWRLSITLRPLLEPVETMLEGFIVLTNVSEALVALRLL